MINVVFNVGTPLVFVYGIVTFTLVTSRNRPHITVVCNVSSVNAPNIGWPLCFLLCDFLHAYEVTEILYYLKAATTRVKP